MSITHWLKEIMLHRNRFFLYVRRISIQSKEFWSKWLCWVKWSDEIFLLNQYLIVFLSSEDFLWLCFSICLIDFMIRVKQRNQRMWNREFTSKHTVKSLNYILLSLVKCSCIKVEIKVMVSSPVFFPITAIDEYFNKMTTIKLHHWLSLVVCSSYNIFRAYGNHVEYSVKSLKYVIYWKDFLV